MVIYNISLKDNSQPDNPYDTKQHKLLPSIVFESNIPNPEPTVTVRLEFSEPEFAILDALLMPVKITKTAVSTTVIEYTGLYSYMNILFDQGNGYSRLFLNYDNSESKGPKYFKPFTINVTVTDNRQPDVFTSIWQYNPPLNITYQNTYNYIIGDNILTDAPQFTKHTSIEDEWDFDLFYPTFDDQMNVVGSYFINNRSVDPNGYDEIYPFQTRDSVGIYSIYGEFFGEIGEQCEFFYKIENEKVFWWARSVQDYVYKLKEVNYLTPRLNNYNEPCMVNFVTAFRNKLFITYKELPNKIDIFKYNPTTESVQFLETITINKWLRTSSILDGKTIKPSIHTYNNTLLIFAGYGNRNFIIEYMFNGVNYDFVSEVELPIAEYRGIYWSTDEFFGYLEHNINTETKYHTTTFSVWKKVLNQWTKMWTITTPNAETDIQVIQNGINPFKRVIMSNNTSDYFIHYLQNFNGELIQFKDGIYQSVKIINKPFPDYNTDSVRMYWDALFYNHPEPVGYGNQYYSYRTGDFASYAWNSSPVNYLTQIKLEDTFIANTDYINAFTDIIDCGKLFEPINELIGNGLITAGINLITDCGFITDSVDSGITDIAKEPGWTSHWVASPDIKTVFKYGELNNVFWGSVKNGFLRKVPIQTVNKLFRNFTFRTNDNFIGMIEYINDYGMVVQQVNETDDCGNVENTVTEIDNNGFIEETNVSLLTMNKDIPVFWVLRNRKTDVQTGGWFLWKRSI